MKFELEEVVPGVADNHVQLEFVRNLRNSVRENMTGNQEYIHRDQQIKWFKGLDHEELRLFLFWADFELSGYGIVRSKDGNPWLTGVLCEHQRGKGYGVELFSLLVAAAGDGAVYLDVFKRNEPALKVYENVGFRVIDEVDDKMVMEFTP